MQNGIKRAVMVLKRVHKFFDTPPINRESLIPLPMNRDYLFEWLVFNEQNEAGMLLCELQDEVISS